MAQKRRQFISNIAAGSLILSASEISCRFSESTNEKPTEPEIASGDQKWQSVRKMYPREVVTYFNNAGLSPMPAFILSTYLKSIESGNNSPSGMYFKEFGDLRPKVRKKIASLIHARDSEIGLVRNTTEALHNVILGIQWNTGDEVVSTTHDYPTVLQALEYIQKKHGVVVKLIELKVPATNKNDIIDKFEKACSDKTKLLICSQVIYVTGETIPVQEISKVAKRYNAFLLIDGAQSFGLLPLNIREMNCDFFASCFHKWIGGPVGGGFLYINESLIEDIDPRYPSSIKDLNTINQFHHTGTFNNAIWQATLKALDFYEKLNIKEKYQRLIFLRDYFEKELSRYFSNDLIINSSSGDQYSPLLNFSFKGIDLNEISSELRKSNFTLTSMNHNTARGLRFSPNIFHNELDIDQLVSFFGHFNRK